MIRQHADDDEQAQRLYRLRQEEIDLAHQGESITLPFEETIERILHPTPRLRFDAAGRYIPRSRQG